MKFIMREADDLLSNDDLFLIQSTNIGRTKIFFATAIDVAVFLTHMS